MTSNLRLKICLLADYSPNLDEGMRNIAFHLSNFLSTHHEVNLLTLSRMSSRSFWKELKSFDPDIVHHVPGPSIFSLLITKLLKIHCRKAKTVVSAVHPVFYGLRGVRYGPYAGASSLLSPLIPLLKPDVVLVQSRQSESFFEKKGCKTAFVPSGVNIAKLTPASPELKRRLRQKYGIDNHTFVIMHVGPLSKGRNVQLLARLKIGDTTPVLIGSTENSSPKVIHRLRENGCIVWHEYIECIEEIYQLADCYVFPTIEERSCIEIPLSVLEAMSCNLPVVSTRFGALPRLFEERNGFFYAETEDEFTAHLRNIRNGVEVTTRASVQHYTWASVSEGIEQIYMSLLNDTQAA